MEEAGKVENQPSEEIIENVVKMNLEEALSRHRKEIAQVAEQRNCYEKNDCKAEQKAKKKQVDDENAKLSSDLKEKQCPAWVSIILYFEIGNVYLYFEIGNVYFILHLTYMRNDVYFCYE
ncbi:hypothetical protein GIB67_000305 [Kingdonia uniflora]|uniref:Uncharacterized protein n=1 Tax=Kingdonia uniflora TaxID=39325 RepID=A0A7J7LC89_9MAGN|nr:hypothetical protein GIB67_000305 [Kingdonia uniflora]